MDGHLGRARARAARARGRDADAGALQLPAQRDVRHDDAGAAHGQPRRPEAAGHRGPRAPAHGRRAPGDAAAGRRQLRERLGPRDAAERHGLGAGRLPGLHRGLQGRRRPHQAAPAPAPAQGLFSIRGQEPGHRAAGRGPRRGGQADITRRAVVQRPALHGHQARHGAPLGRAASGREAAEGRRRTGPRPPLGRGRGRDAAAGAQEAGVPPGARGRRRGQGRVRGQRPRRRHRGPALPPGAAAPGDERHARLPRGAVRARGARGRVPGAAGGGGHAQGLVERPAGGHLHERRRGRRAAGGRAVDHRGPREHQHAVRARAGRVSVFRPPLVGDGHHVRHRGPQGLLRRDARRRHRHRGGLRVRRGALGEGEVSYADAVTGTSKFSRESLGRRLRADLHEPAVAQFGLHARTGRLLLPEPRVIHAVHLLEVAVDVAQVDGDGQQAVAVRARVLEDGVEARERLRRLHVDGRVLVRAHDALRLHAAVVLDPLGHAPGLEARRPQHPLAAARADALRDHADERRDAERRELAQELELHGGAGIRSEITSRVRCRGGACCCNFGGVVLRLAGAFMRRSTLRQRSLRRRIGSRQLWMI
mmetsp:Transcript_17237/g.51454  ORF Transcript_17237/g.51454 Transcript_17237/m.51454 type:complete len:592 (+) Transcript_17237:632-2407(+)